MLPTFVTSQGALHILSRESSFSTIHDLDPARIEILWVATIECQSLQDYAMIWQEIVNYRKTQFR